MSTWWLQMRILNHEIIFRNLLHSCNIQYYLTTLWPLLIKNSPLCYLSDSIENSSWDGALCFRPLSLLCASRQVGKVPRRQIGFFFFRKQRCCCAFSTKRELHSKEFQITQSFHSRPHNAQGSILLPPSPVVNIHLLDIEGEMERQRDCCLHHAASAGRWFTFSLQISMLSLLKLWLE